MLREEYPCRIRGCVEIWTCSRAHAAENHQREDRIYTGGRDPSRPLAMTLFSVSPALIMFEHRFAGQAALGIVFHYVPCSCSRRARTSENARN